MVAWWRGGAAMGPAGGREAARREGGDAMNKTQGYVGAPKPTREPRRPAGHKGSMTERAQAVARKLNIKWRGNYTKMAADCLKRRRSTGMNN